MALAAVTALFIAALLTIPLLPDKVSVRLGESAREDVFAPRHAQYRDDARTEMLRRLVASQVPRVYSTVLGVRLQAREATVAFFAASEGVPSGEGAPPGGTGRAAAESRRILAMKKRAPGLSPALLRVAAGLEPQQLAEARDHAGQLVDELMAQPITDEALGDMRVLARTRAQSLPLAPKVRRLVGEVVALNLLPNQLYNAQETEAAREREVAQVSQQYQYIRRGDLVIRRGDRVTQEHLDKLALLGLVRERIDVWAAVSRILLSIGLVAVCCLYLFQFHPRVFRSFNSLLLLAVVVCGSLLLFRIGSSALGLRFSGDQLGFLGMLCSALGAMLIAGLLCPQIAVFVGVALAVLTSVLVGAELKFAILSIVSSLTAVQCVSNIRNRAGILRACLTLASVNVVTAFVARGATELGFGEASVAGPWAAVGQDSLWAVIGGVGSVLLWMLFTAWLERPFRLTTHLTLLELSDPSHVLLRRLAMEAPGTYSHSIIVGNLAEAAAEAIGADGLFCRVASLYHDIGKVVRPHFFIENQLSENRHNAINPSLSSLIVTSHVRDGVELAEEHRLPPPVIAIIREHHGTCLIKYFYHRALTSGGEEGTSALEYQFRYEGPRPQTKESGIIMIADSAEAASRTLEKPTPGRIRDMIDRIVRDRLSDGQLDECELTFKDLEKIVASITRSLTSLLHARIEYPAGDTGNLRRLAADGGAGKEPVGVQRALSDTPEAAPGAFGRPAGL